MDLKEINKQYQDLQKDLKEMNERVEKISKEAKVLVEDKIILKGKLIKAKRENDETVQKDTEKELEKLEEKLKAMKEEAMTKKAAIITTKRAIDARIEQIKADPEMKKHLESVMATKYERKLAKVRDEKEGVEQEKERFELLKTLISQHPTLENNLKGMLGAVNKGNEVKKELEEIEQKLVKDGITAEGMKAYKDKAKE